MIKNCVGHMILTLGKGEEKKQETGNLFQIYFVSGTVRYISHRYYFICKHWRNLVTRDNILDWEFLFPSVWVQSQRFQRQGGPSQVILFKEKYELIYVVCESGKVVFREDQGQCVAHWKRDSRNRDFRVCRSSPGEVQVMVTILTERKGQIQKIILERGFPH